MTRTREELRKEYQDRIQQAAGDLEDALAEKEADVINDQAWLWEIEDDDERNELYDLVFEEKDKDRFNVQSMLDEIYREIGSMQIALQKSEEVGEIMRVATELEHLKYMHSWLLEYVNDHSIKC